MRQATMAASEDNVERAELHTGIGTAGTQFRPETALGY